MVLHQVSLPIGLSSLSVCEKLNYFVPGPEPSQTLIHANASYAGPT
jgi:hypothetical protein